MAMNPEFYQLGAVAIIFVFAIKEFFSYLKSRKFPNNIETNNQILNELKIMNNNHLTSICKCIEDGNKDLIEVMHQDNMKIIELLGEIHGQLSR